MSSESEREALANLVQLGFVTDWYEAADRILAAGFRRTEVPEPSAEGDEFAQDECDGSGKCPALRHIHGCYTRHRADQCDSPDEYGHLPLSPQGEPSDAPNVVTLDDVYEVTGLEALVAEARSRGEWCCENGCGSGACETCPCCSAGWCVSGVDGVPDDPEDRERWLEVAAEHNPVAAALRAAGGAR